MNRKAGTMFAPRLPAVATALLVSVLTIVAAGACSPARNDLSGEQPGSQTSGGTALHMHQSTTEPVAISRATGVRPVVTVNVTIDETTISPPVLNVPAGTPVRLVLRNHGTREHHFHVQRVHPSEMLWLAKDLEPGTALEMAGSEHGAHHSGQMLPYHICTSRTGLCPTGLDLHAHAGPGEIDVIQFTAPQPGSYQAICPLHPGVQSMVVVF